MREEGGEGTHGGMSVVPQRAGVDRLPLRVSQPPEPGGERPCRGAGERRRPRRGGIVASPQVSADATGAPAMMSGGGGHGIMEPEIGRWQGVIGCCCFWVAISFRICMHMPCVRRRRPSQGQERNRRILFFFLPNLILSGIDPGVTVILLFIKILHFPPCPLVLLTNNIFRVTRILFQDVFKKSCDEIR